MQPVQGGNFCQLCEKTVVDFTRKTNDEIKAYLLENHTKKICGRIVNKQLNEMSGDYSEWENQHPLVFQSKFVYALLLVFGMALFQLDATAQDTLSAQINPVEAFSQPDSTSAMNLENSVDTSQAISLDPFILGIGNLGGFPYVEVTGGAVLPEFEIITITAGFMVSDIESTYEIATTEPAIICPNPGAIAIFCPKYGPHEYRSVLLPPSTIVLDFKLPFNELENMLGDKRLTAKVSNDINPYIFDLELNSELTDDLQITVLAPNGERREICNRYALPGIQRFSIDLTHYPAVPYQVMIQQGTLRKSLFIRRPE